jgi:hypothetical protein
VTRGLLDVTRFLLDEDVILRTIAFLREVGQAGNEGFVLWSGTFEDPRTFHFRTSIIPAQEAHTTATGLLVVVPGAELFVVNRDVHSRGEVLAAQVHSHPTDAYHSTTDDRYPLVTLVGALSVVIPNFARNAPADVAEWAWLRLSAHGTWEPADEATEVTVV